MLAGNGGRLERKGSTQNCVVMCVGEDKRCILFKGVGRHQKYPLLLFLYEEWRGVTLRILWENLKPLPDLYGQAFVVSQSKGL
jgi:hypothetical protein